MRHLVLTQRVHITNQIIKLDPAPRLQLFTAILIWIHSSEPLIEVCRYGFDNITVDIPDPVALNHHKVGRLVVVVKLARSGQLC